MTRTDRRIANRRTVIIGFDQPFCVIGERINPTGRKALAAELEAGDFSTVERDALEQVACGASMLDVNAGVGLTTPTPLPDNETSRAAADARDDRAASRALVDVAALHRQLGVPARSRPGSRPPTAARCSTPSPARRSGWSCVLPLVKKYNVPVVAISNDDTGISEDPDVRFAVAKKIVERAADFGIPAHDIVVDPLVMPIGAMATAGLQVFALVRRLREELGVNTTCGASNISFGLPNRHGINAAFLPMAIASGMTSAIMNPVRPQEMEAIRAANLLTNNDPWGAAWIRANKAPLAEGEVEAGARGRREGRGRRRG